jgi:cystathionine beta-lyase/cystathionine gamma-synthase
LLHRGIKTLALRVERQNANAAMLAAALEQHPQVRASCLYASMQLRSEEYSSANAAMLAAGLKNHP